MIGISLLLVLCFGFSSCFFEGFFGLTSSEVTSKFQNLNATFTTSTPNPLGSPPSTPNPLGSPPSTRNPFATTFKAGNTPYPCLYGVCNGTCCKSDSVEAFFDCANGQKIDKSLVCNKQNDCSDGSDEAICVPWPPKMTLLPKHEVEVYCGDQDNKKSESFVLECESVGYPIPRIRWKKYEGHVPSKCSQYSRQGHGILTCPNFQQSDQGAYSCVAENSVKLAESQPKTIVRCSNAIYCKGFTVVNEENISHCLECFCSGKTTQCQSIKSNLTLIELPFPEAKTEIFANEDGEILFIPTNTELTPSNTVRQSSQEITYCSLTENDLQGLSLLKSFGRSIIIPRYKGEASFLPNAPALIIRGNGLSLMYTANLISLPKESAMAMSVRFWPGNWHHLNKQAANRTDLMKVLSNVDSLLIRCEYEPGTTLNWSKNASVIVQSSIVTDNTNSVSYVEKCHCPRGYDGLSCETCADGYKKEALGKDFVCKEIPPPTCEVGYKGVNCSICDKDYQRVGNVCVKNVCHPYGSTSQTPFLGQCTCREGVTGKFCDKCQDGYFHLNKAKGCNKCWCSGVTNTCNSSSLYRTVISNIPRGGYNYSDGRNFWLLPSDFTGNHLTSYGGFLNYTMRYKPNMQKEKTYLTVELLSKEDVTLSYTHATMDTSMTSFFRDEKSWSVPLTEFNWKTVNKTNVDRGEFLKVLSGLKAVYVESPYHLSSGNVTLTSVLMSTASSTADGGSDLALAVEQCSCPKGYSGLSCEKCSEGYYRKRNGTMNSCIKCNCPNCDPDFGCPECPQLTYRDNPANEKMPVCKPCPCQENGLSCVKDDYNQIFCKCKPGFTGMHCKHELPGEKDELTIIISPRRFKNKKTDTVFTFNCTVITREEMILTAAKNYGTPTLSFLKGTSLNSNGSSISKIFEVTLDAGLKSVECFAHDSDKKLAGHAIATVEPIDIYKPVTIKNCYSDKIDVKESESKELICETSGFPIPIVNWYKSVNGSKPEKVDTSEGVHTIESASLRDNGTVYTCIAENSNGDKAVCARILIVRKKCEVVNIFPNKVKAKEGQNITLVCKTTAKSPVTWTKLAGNLLWESPQGATVKDGVLRKTNVTISDSGTYLCSATVENGKINKTVSVIVEERKEPPSVTIEEYDKKLKIGDSFTMHCMVTGKPLPVVTWKKLNGSLSSNVVIHGKRLTINKAKMENAGIYICEGASSLGNASSYISIEVEYNAIPPKVNISQATISAVEGSKVKLTCSAIGYPRPKLNWIAPNISFSSVARVSDDTVLNEPYESENVEVKFKISRKMNGLSILCIAENVAGRDEVATKIKVYSLLEGVNETVEFVPIGSYFELVCEVGVSDVISWEKSPGGLVGDECPIPAGLMIPSVQKQHNGTYKCKTESGVKKIINLFVVGFVPKFSSALRSYMVVPMQLSPTSGSRIEMYFRATRDFGLLLQTSNNKLKIYLEHRKMHFSSEGDLLDIALNNPIELWKWYSFVASFGKDYVDITVYDESMTIFERKTEYHQDFDMNLGLDKDSFFLGGPVPKARHFGGLPFQRYPHFDGCISRFIVNQHEYDIVKESSYSHNVTLCRRCSEEPNPCHDEGKCLDAPTQYGFICVCPRNRQKFSYQSETCPASCAGKGCETKLDFCSLLKPCKRSIQNSCENASYRLYCQCGSGYSGLTCEKEIQYSFCSAGEGYVKLHSSLLQRLLEAPEIIRMHFTTNKPNGQLLWQGNKADHLSISVHRGKLKYIYQNQHLKLEINGPNIEAKEYYVLTVVRRNNSATLEVIKEGRESTSTYRNSTNKIHTNRVAGDIYLGIVPKNIFHAGHHVGLSGCIYSVTFGENGKVNLLENTVEKVNVFPPDNKYVDVGESEYENNEISLEGWERIIQPPI